MNGAIQHKSTSIGLLPKIEGIEYDVHVPASTSPGRYTLILRLRLEGERFGVCDQAAGEWTLLDFVVV